MKWKVEVSGSATYPSFEREFNVEFAEEAMDLMSLEVSDIYGYSDDFQFTDTMPDDNFIKDFTHVQPCLTGEALVLSNVNWERMAKVCESYGMRAGAVYCWHKSLVYSQPTLISNHVTSNALLFWSNSVGHSQRMGIKTDGRSPLYDEEKMMDVIDLAVIKGRSQLEELGLLEGILNK